MLFNSGVTYESGETRQSMCDRCTCRNGAWQCAPIDGCTEDTICPEVQRLTHNECISQNRFCRVYIHQNNGKITCLNMLIKKLFLFFLLSAAVALQVEFTDPYLLF